MAEKHPTSIPSKSLAIPHRRYVITFWLSLAVAALSCLMLVQAYQNHVTFLNEGDKAGQALAALGGEE